MRDVTNETDHRWQRRRHELLTHRSFRCEACHSHRKDLRVVYFGADEPKVPSTMPNGDFMVVCAGCKAALEAAVNAIPLNIRWLLSTDDLQGENSE